MTAFAWYKQTPSDWELILSVKLLDVVFNAKIDMDSIYFANVKVPITPRIF